MELVAYLSGPFRIEDSSGVDLTPTGAKERGLLLLLLTSPSGVRERIWLQDKLWSDRGREQGAGSLRQAVFQCRRALGRWKDILRSEKLRLSLDMSKVTIVEDGAEFAEGLDVRDQEFEAWLSVERSERGDTDMLPAPRPIAARNDMSTIPATVMIESSSSPEPSTAWFRDVVSDLCATSLAELIGAEVIHAGDAAGRLATFRLEIDCCLGEASRLFLRARVVDIGVGSHLWSGYRIVQAQSHGPDRIPAVAQFIAEIAESIRLACARRRHVERDREVPAMSNALAISRLFSMEREGAREADALLRGAYEEDRKAIHLAWRAQVRLIQTVERLEPSVLPMQEESRELIARALETDSNNSMILALAANVHHYLQRDSDMARDFAVRAVRLNGSNPMAWWALASGRLYVGETRQAYKAALVAQRLCERADMRFWPEAILGGAALAMGDHRKALAHFERSLQMRSTSRPSLRHAIALNASAGKLDRARALSVRLSEMEADFEPRRLIDDLDYPTSLLRRDSGIDRQALRSLA